MDRLGRVGQAWQGQKRRDRVRLARGGQRILLLAPHFHEAGGIGRFCRALVEAVETCGHQIRVVSLRDLGKVGFVIAAFRQRTWAEIVLVAHVHLSPLAWALRRPFIACLFGIEVWGRLPFLQAFAIRHATLVAASGYTAMQFLKANRYSGQITVIRPAVADTLLEVGARSVGTPAHRPFTILTLCRHNARERYKGADLVLQALPEVKAKIGAVRYIIAGDGDDLPRLQKLAAFYAPEETLFYGPVPQENLPTLFASCDLFALPSTMDGFAIVLIEAASFGKPVIAGTGGTLEAMVNGETGFPAVSPDQIADRIVELAQNDAKRIAMGRAGRAFVEERFTMARFTRDVEALLAML